MSKRKFKWDAWDFDFDGVAYVIAKDECPERENVADYIITADGLSHECKPDMVIQDGWCKWMVRTDWADRDSEPSGGYVVERVKNRPHDIYGKAKPGWFPVWIVRKGEW